MKVALVHDYIKEYGGAERVLKALSRMYPDAPIYTAFKVKDSAAEKEFRSKNVFESWLAPILKIGKLYSPLRFLAPIVWMSFNLSDYDLVISSSSWFITRGFRIGKNTKVICYCHTPPRWLYGFETSVGFTKYWPVKIYSAIVGYFMRKYDYWTAQKIEFWIANSKNVASRIKKFYGKDSTVIYPPVNVSEIVKESVGAGNKEDYFLMVSRLVGAKGLEEAARAFSNLNYKLKIVGEAHGLSDVASSLKKLAGGNIELLGRVDDSELYKLYSGATGFIALARDEDFGMTVVEAQAAGTPVIAFNGGGFRESVVNGKTGILINDTNTKTIHDAVGKIIKTKWNKQALKENARKFSSERFEREFLEFVSSIKN